MKERTAEEQFRESGEDSLLIVTLGFWMAERLAANSHKSRWVDLGTVELLKRIRKELTELELALARGESSTSVAQEAADVANYLAMLACNTRGEP